MRLPFCSNIRIQFSFQAFWATIGGEGRDRFALYVIPFLFCCIFTLTTLGMAEWPIARNLKFVKFPNLDYGRCIVNRNRQLTPM